MISSRGNYRIMIPIRNRMLRHCGLVTKVVEGTKATSGGDRGSIAAIDCVEPQRKFFDMGGGHHPLNEQAPSHGFAVLPLRDISMWLHNCLPLFNAR
jgi:hypothetical protein